MLPDAPIIAVAISAFALDWDAVATTAPGPDVLHIDHRLTVHNHGREARVVDAMADLVPELVDAGGRVVPLAGGRNRAAPPAPMLIAAGGKAVLVVRATLHHRDGGIDWRGHDGFGGRWDVGDFGGRFRLQLRLGNSVSPALRLGGAPP